MGSINSIVRDISNLLKGNLSSREAKEIDGTVRRYLNPSPLHESASTELRCLKILEGTHFLQVTKFMSPLVQNLDV